MYRNSNKLQNILKNNNSLKHKTRSFEKIKFFQCFNLNFKNEYTTRKFSYPSTKNKKYFRYKNLCRITGKYNSIINIGFFKRHIFKNLLLKNYIPRIKKYTK